MRFSACPSLRAATLRLARGYLASKLISATDRSSGCYQSVGERLETSPRERTHEVCHVEMAVSGWILPGGWHDLDLTARLRGNQVRHRPKALGLPGREIDQTCGPPQ